MERVDRAKPKGKKKNKSLFGSSITASVKTEEEKQAEEKKAKVYEELLAQAKAKEYNCSNCKKDIPGTSYYWKDVDGKPIKSSPVCNECRADGGRLEQHLLGLTHSRELKKRQNNKCAICSKTMEGRFTVDHCHSHEDRVRGLNMSLIKFKEEIYSKVPAPTDEAVKFAAEKGRYCRGILCNTCNIHFTEDLEKHHAACTAYLLRTQLSQAHGRMPQYESVTQVPQSINECNERLAAIRKQCGTREAEQWLEASLKLFSTLPKRGVSNVGFDTKYAQADAERLQLLTSQLLIVLAEVFTGN